jgi:hypothetical protein
MYSFKLFYLKIMKPKIFLLSNLLYCKFEKCYLRLLKQPFMTCVLRKLTSVFSFNFFVDYELSYVSPVLCRSISNTDLHIIFSASFVCNWNPATTNTNFIENVLRV